MNGRLKRNIADFQRYIIENPYIPHEPTDKQALFLLQNDILEGFYGGAAGGGKTEALLCDALRYVELEGYSALLLRRTFPELTKPEALMDRARDWLSTKQATWSEKYKQWSFPSGATLTFGYLQFEGDKYQYQGAAFQYIGFDELTQFTESQYNYLFSRLRRLQDTEIPLRMRAGSNPGNIGHEWVKRKFITPSQEELREQNRFFVPAFLEDNPYLDRGTYEESLMRLDPVTYEQLRKGNWDISIKGELFDRSWFELVDNCSVSRQQVRYWDLAATEQTSTNKDPDWTVGLLLGYDGHHYCVKDIQRVRKNPGDVEILIKQTAEIDGYTTAIWIEQEPGSSGVNTINHYARDILRGYNFHGNRETGSKPERTKLVSAAASNRLIKVKNAPWLNDFFTELELFPTKGYHDDIVDALSGAFNKLTQEQPKPPSVTLGPAIAIKSNSHRY